MYGLNQQTKPIFSTKTMLLIDSVTLNCQVPDTLGPKRFGCSPALTQLRVVFAGFGKQRRPRFLLRAALPSRRDDWTPSLWSLCARALGTEAQGAYDPFTMPYNNTASLVPGFREAMLNMNIGDKARIFIPSYLGYGSRGNGPVPPNSNLIFDIELVGKE